MLGYSKSNLKAIIAGLIMFVGFPLIAAIAASIK